MESNLDSVFLLEDDDRAFLESLMNGGLELSGSAAATQTDREPISTLFGRSARPRGLPVLYDDDIRGIGLDEKIVRPLMREDLWYVGSLSRSTSADTLRVSAETLHDAHSVIRRRARALEPIVSHDSKLTRYLGSLSAISGVIFDPMGFARPIKLMRGNGGEGRCEAVHLLSIWLSENTVRLQAGTRDEDEGDYTLGALSLSQTMRERLESSGISSARILAKTPKAELMRIPGIGEKRARILIRDAERALKAHQVSLPVGDRTMSDEELGAGLLSNFDDYAISLANSVYENMRVYGEPVAEIPFLLWALPISAVLLRENSYEVAGRLLGDALGWFRFDGIGAIPAERPSSPSPVLAGPIDLEEWVCGDYLPPKARACISRRLNGETLESIGRRYDITRERVRQLVRDALEKRPAIRQDAYLDLIAREDFSEESFSEETGEGPRTIAYLKLVESLEPALKKSRVL